MNKEITELFKDIETAFLNTIPMLAINSEVYVCGLWLFYCDYSVIHAPCFGYNNTFVNADDKWSPPEWHVDVDDDIENALSPLYEKLSQLMVDKTDQDWESLIEYQWLFYAELCLKLNSNMHTKNSPFGNWFTSKDFIIGIFEEREEEAIYKKLLIDSVGLTRVQKLSIL